MSGDSQTRAAARLIGDTLVGVIGVVEAMQATTTAKVERLLPKATEPAMVVHKVAVRTTYALVSAGHRVTALATGEVIARRRGDSATPIAETTWGRTALPALSGIWGDRIAEREPELDIPMSIRVNGTRVGLNPDALASAFPEPSGSLVVFVHGLSENDEVWLKPFGRSGQQRKVVAGSVPAVGQDLGDPDSSTGGIDSRGGGACDDDYDPADYGSALARDLGMTPVRIRYNSGRHVSDNGRALADLMASLTTHWPVPVTDISLVGHSMGGLISRSAVHLGGTDDADWVARLRHVVTLGTPHLGAPLEKGVHLADWALRRFDGSRPLSSLLRSRSAGVRDLRFGGLVDADRIPDDSDDLFTDRSSTVPFEDHVNYFFLSSTIASGTSARIGHLVGDGMVLPASASGRGRSSRIPAATDTAHVAGVGHLALVNHPTVYPVLRDWLATEPKG